MDKDTARRQIATLVDRYRAITAAKRRLTEQETRLSFILPLFRALGWDDQNPAEVSAEEQISRGYVDFGFYLNGAPVFYLETKKLGADADNPDFLRQAINYAYLRGVTWAVLTNFERLVVLNAEWEERDPAKAIALNLPCTDYANGGFDDLWRLSKPAMQACDLDKWAERYGRKARKQPVTTVLFSDLTRWRRSLFADMRAYSPPLFSANARDVDNAVQRLLDRLIFIRTVEDRGVEPQRLLLPLLRQHMRGDKIVTDPYPDLLKLFRELDAVYNSNLFAEHTLDRLAVHDAGLIRDVIDGLYRVKGGYASYDFNAISADVLGAVYEQYLSFRASDPEARQEVDIAKRARRKQQGIYYTPQFVVRYIVRQTLGRLLDDPAMTPERARRLRVLDPACGSGSFLIEAFDVLDRWLAQHDPHTDARARRLAILQDNLYGVDLDDQAVEVTRLNLMLRAAQERGLLPKLTHIAHGNSLVDDPAVDPHAFDWAARFPDAMHDGGFDVVIGNPPYVRAESLSAAFKDYARAHYETYAGTADLYVYMIERGVKLLRAGGVYGIIVANKWLRAAYGRPLRRWLKERQLDELIDFGDLPVFQDAVTYPCVLIASRPPADAPPRPDFTAAQVDTLNFNDLHSHLHTRRHPLARARLDDGGWSLAPASQQALLDKLRAAGQPLADYVDGKIYRGVLTGLNEAFVIDSPTRARLIREDPRSAELIKPFLLGRDIRRYETPQAKQYLILMPNGWTRQRAGESDAWAWLNAHYPALARHLEPFAEKAAKRWDKGEHWWELRPCDYYAAFDQPKIIIPSIIKEPSFMLDRAGFYSNDKTAIVASESLYLLGVLNSAVCAHFMQKIASTKQGGFLEYKPMYVSQIPIPEPPDAAQHDHLAALVERMLDLKRQHAAESVLFSERRHDLAQQIARTDAEIDRLVCALYGLTEAETALVLGSAGQGRGV